MDILLQSDGQLYPPRHTERKREPKPKPKPKPEPPPPPCPAPKAEPCPPANTVSFEELLLIGVAFIVFRASKEPDIPLLLALAYILFDPQFSLKGLF